MTLSLARSMPQGAVGVAAVAPADAGAVTAAVAAVPACMTVQGKVLPGALEMQHSPQRGYCIVARKAIPAGAVLLQVRTYCVACVAGAGCLKAAQHQ